MWCAGKKIDITIMSYFTDFKITFAPLCLTEVYQLADNPANGAIALMSGTVRCQTEGKR